MTDNKGSEIVGKSTKAECDYLNGWITYACAKLSPKMVKPRDIGGNAEEEEEDSVKTRTSLER